MRTTQDTLPAARSAETMLTLGWAGFLVLAIGTPPAYPATAPEEGSRIPLVVLPLENRTGNPDLAFWTHAATGMLRTRLYTVHTLKSTPWTKALKAWERTGLEPGDPIGEEHARQMGEELQRRYVVWGHYDRIDAKWQITVRIFETETGQSSPEFTARAAFWLDAADQDVAQILHHLELSPTEEEQRKMARRMTHSPMALEWTAKAFAAEVEERPASEVEALARKALAEDPESKTIRMDVAGTLAAQDEFEGARKLTRQVLKEDPDFYRANFLMGAIEFNVDRNFDAAETHLKKATEVEPMETQALGMLGDLYAFQGKWSEAIKAFEQKLKLNPENSIVWANLSELHKILGQMEEARHTVGRAVEFNDGSALALVNIVEAYINLDDIPKAKEFYEQLCALAQTETVDETVLKEMADTIHGLEQRSSPSYVQAEHPRDYSANELQETLQSILTQEEFALVENPIDATAEMKAWAREIVGEETNAFGKAKRLFDTLDRRVHKWGQGGARTATEVYELWNDPDRSFSCQEYAKLYIVLAREVGLDAYYVHLDKDYEGQAVYHDCAGVFLDQGCLLADPAYRWFGVPHQKAVVMDDLQMLAHHALQGTDIAHCRMALKLHPDLAWNRVKFAEALFLESRLNEAEHELERAQALEPDRWDISQLRGAIAMERGDLVTAENELKKSLEANSADPTTHLALAELQVNTLRLEDAKQSLLSALKYAKKRSDPETAGAALQALRFHQELTAAQQGDLSAKGDLRKRAEAGDPEMQTTLAAFLLQQPKPDYQEIMELFRRASEQGLALASLNLAKMYQHGVGVAQDKEAAHQWLLKAAEQGNPEAMLHISADYFDGIGVPANTQKGLEWVTRAADMGFASAQYQLGRLYYEGRVLKMDYPQAFQWLSFAQRSGHKGAKALLAELKIFMSTEELRQGQQRLEQYTAQRSGK